ncbi:hypothetical protein HUN33_15600 [Acinetobacter bereziniae]|nr:hypothetical protein [Acinetobacter bereziniae]NUG06508.1 hypothetical protein [Acinetobacter bereziniae]NUG63887.1 hypothetical protein [Acinetobacter bereziniae]NUG71192.1 hypothetical protein [Acinetobacter bereziniae]NUG81458.1 hypothetical protein [Acinetobacter bereziniae]
MWMLMRTISAYRFIDIILGIFTTLEDAEKARIQYMTYRKDHDPWHDQAYRESSLADDLRIIAVDGNFRNGEIVFEISEYIESFGQIVRALKAITFTQAEAIACIQRLEAVEHEFPQFAEIDYLKIGTLHSDLSEDQPISYPRNETDLAQTGKREFSDILDIDFV